MYFSIPIILLVLVDQSLNSENIHLKKNDDNKILIDKYDIYRKYIQYTIIGLIIIGFIHYYFRQKNKFGKNFNSFKFIFDVRCKNKII